MSQENSVYDYVILGAGLAGLMLINRLKNDPYFDTYSILVIDKEQKEDNDRTWCFWEKGVSDWEHIISKKWDTIYFGSSLYTNKIPIAPYSYNKIEAKDFYAYSLNNLALAKNVTFIKDEIKMCNEEDDLVHLVGKKETYTSQKLFTSILPPERLAQQKTHPVLQQHFIGWFIKSEEDIFDPDVATFMDFTVPQKGNTRFMYVLPVSRNQSLVEYTLFSQHLLKEEAYETAIMQYLNDLGIGNYTIVDKEKGAIPMTAYPFEKHNTTRIMHIGTAGGWTRGSTGYTFNYASKLSKALVAFLKREDDFTRFKIKDRYRWYDDLFLDVLYRHNELGAELFAHMFKANKISKIFKFLDGESSMFDDLKIINSLPKKEFIKSFFSQRKPSS